MNEAQLRDLLMQAESNVRSAHRAYTVALKGDGDTTDSWETLLKANVLKDQIYNQLLKAIAAG